QRAMKMRGFKNKKFSLRNLKILASLTGSLLVSSYEKSKRVYQAMILRGYGQKPTSALKPNSLAGQNKIALLVTLIFALGFVSAEIILSLFP
ncbi:MAG: energy-coupling factor transporter transmembrane component T, partial [Spirulinaceae cyanobacterium]